VLRARRISGGSPFFITEVLFSPGSTVPLTVSHAGLTRVSRLSAAARQLLDLVCRNEHDLKVVKDVYSRPTLT